MARQVWYFICLFLLLNVTVQINCSGSHEHKDENVGRNQIFEKLYDHMNITLNSTEAHLKISAKDLTSFLKDLNFNKCKPNYTSIESCNLCLTANDFLKWNGYNVSHNLTKKQFQEIIPSLLYMLTTPDSFKSSNDNQTTCREKVNNATSERSDIFQKFQNKYGSIITEESVEKILKDVNGTIKEKLTGDECFSVHDVIKGANVSESNITEHEFEYVSGFILLKLADKNCIAEEESGHGEHGHGENGHKHDNNNTTTNSTKETLPKSTFFLEHIFETYSNRSNNNTMTHDNFVRFYSKLKLGKTVMKTTKIETDTHAGHSHKRRRREINHTEGDHDGHHHDGEHDDDEKFLKCYSAEQILEIYKVAEDSTINKNKFKEICPALVQQLEHGSCQTKVEIMKEKQHSEEHQTWKPWVGMLVSIFIISLASITGIFMSPFLQKKWFPYLIMGLIALAVSVLISDSILHLLPHSLDLHKHGDEGSKGHHGHGEENPLLAKDSYIWKCVLFLSGFYVFLMFEIIMRTFNPNHSHSHDYTSRQSQDTVIYNPQIEQGQLEFKNNGNAQIQPRKEFNAKALPVKKFHSIAWMVIIGDSIHNFLDGIAIGVAFSETWPSGLHGGISTSIAILCHELPHEIGDFAVLLNSGLSMKQAILMNFLSSLTAFIGGIVGVVLGTEWNASSWIFAITAGLFIYIALVDMLPEVLNSSILKERPRLSIFVINISMLFGFVILFVLAAWEEDIKSALKEEH